MNQDHYIIIINNMAIVLVLMIPGFWNLISVADNSCCHVDAILKKSYKRLNLHAFYKHPERKIGH